MLDTMTTTSGLYVVFTKEEVDPTLIETEFNEACKALEEAKSQKEKIESSVILKRAKVKLELSKI